MKIFVAGGTGMVGASIITYLVEHMPAVTIRSSYYHTKPFVGQDKVEYIRGNLTNLKICQLMLKGCDVAIMAAAKTANASTISMFPASFIRENLMINVNFLEACNLARMKRVILIGSATLYHDFHGAIKENMLDLNKDPHISYFGFGWVMRFVEKLCLFWYKHVGMEVILIRASNIFGPYAKFNPHTSNFIPAIIRKAVEHQDPFEVWSSPSVIRDVLYSEDFARAIGMLLERDDIKFDVFNIGSGIPTTVSDVVYYALKYAKHTPSKVVYDNSKPATMEFRLLDCSKANVQLGWKPEISIERGIELTTYWWIQNAKEWTK